MSSKICAGDFDKGEFQEIVKPYSRDRYSSVSSAFNNAAQRAKDEGNKKKEQMYGLFARVFSMMITDKTGNELFRELMRMGDRRSAIESDFTADDIAFFAEILEKVENNRLRARLADLVWRNAPKKDLKYAHIAIEAYNQSADITIHTWIDDGKECWYRAFRLSREIKQETKGMEDEVQSAFDKSIKDNEHILTLDLARMMLSLGLCKKERKSNAEKIESLAKKLESTTDGMSPETSYEVASYLYKSAGDNTKNAKMIARQAEYWARCGTDKAEALNAKSACDKAIHLYRNIPKGERSALGVDERIKELLIMSEKAGRRSREAMTTHESKPIDLAEPAEISKATVSGKTPIEALVEFVNLTNIINFSEMQEEAVKALNGCFFTTFFNSTTIDKDGRTVAKTKGVDVDTPLSVDHPKVHEQLMRRYPLLTDIIVAGQVLPALETIRNEHDLQEADFDKIVQGSHIVPPGREALFAKGLYAGYKGDYATALHILTPQFEHLVRYHLKERGAATFTSNNDGIETENGLNTLAKLPEMQEVFGDDTSFEIRVLFCDPIGANIRNKLAHGLIGDDSCESFASIYVWWYVLRFVVNTLDDYS